VHRFVADDRGDALFMVSVMGAVMFLLVTSLIAVAVWQQNTASTRTRTAQATNIADAGINAYLYQLRQNNLYYQGHADTGWVSMGTDGSYRVWATAPTPSNPLTLRSTGNSHNASMTVVATVGFPTFADYMFLTNCDINIGSAALITGQVRSNGDVNNAGEVTGLVQAAGTVSGSGTFDQGKLSNQPAIDFNKVLVDMANIKTVATGSGTAYPNLGSSYSGYAVTLNGAQATIAKVTGVNSTTGNLTTTGATTVNIPSTGVFYFADTVYVQGTYSAAVSIVSNETIYTVGNFLPVNPGGTYTAGLIAQNDILTPTDWSSLPTDLTLYAALLAQSGTCEATMAQNRTKNSLTIHGALAYNTTGGYSQSGWGGVTRGFVDREYDYDMRFQFDPPPMFPDTGSTGALKVNSWVEGTPVG